MVVTLTGNNGFGLQSALKVLLGTFTSSYGDIAIERLDGEEASFERIQQGLQSLPFLSERKMVVLRSPSLHKQFVDDIEELLAGVPETTDVLVVEPKLDQRSSYYKFLKKATDFRSFGELDEGSLVRWLMQATKAKQGSIDSSDARFLVERVGLNQQLLENELEKLLLYRPHITRPTIELLTDPTPQSSIFDLIDAAFAGNMERALALYRDQREQKVEPAKIIAMVTWQLKILALIKVAGGRSSDDIAREAKLKPFSVRKSQAIADRLTLASLRQLMSNLLSIDVRSKRQNIDLDEALQAFFLELAA